MACLEGVERSAGDSYVEVALYRGHGVGSVENTTADRSDPDRYDGRRAEEGPRTAPPPLGVSGD